MPSTQQIKSFYDGFNPDEKPNKRHHRIVQWLKEFGLKPGMRVLEIGCGSGTVSSLVSSSLAPGGKLTAMDISPARIQRARSIYAHLQNIEFVEGDVMQFEADKQFDFVFLPDVLEHIPADKHADLFYKIEKMLVDHGTVVIHIPDPVNLDSIRAKAPHRLQPIDQSLYLPHLYQTLARPGFYIVSLQSYRVWKKVIEYQVICARKKIYLEKQLFV